MLRTDFSKIKLCNYLSPEGAKRTLSTRTIRLAKPSQFNDPFDMRLDEVFGLDIIQFVEAQKHVIVDFLSGELNSLRLSKLGVMAGIINKSMRDASLRKKKIIRDELTATPIEKLYDFDSLRKIEAKVLERFQTEMDRFGIFCTTLNHNSLLMWAHYAQSHQGAVLEFAPDFNRNSVLCASRPVRYSNERPLLYRTPSDMLRHGLTMSAEESGAIAESW